jgi:hypothetical protein
MATSSSNTGTIVRLLLIVAAAVILFALVSYYQSTRASERFSTADVVSGPAPAPVGAPSQSAGAPYGGAAPSASAPLNIGSAAAPYAPAGPSPIEALGNEKYLPVGMNDPSVGTAPIDPFPADRITPEQLLPKDSANSKWAQANPAGQGDVKDQNFLTASYHSGFDTVGSSLRNASHDLRSTPPCPRARVSIWSQSTIEPDLARKELS